MTAGPESPEPSAEFLEAIRKGERRALAQAITLLESSRSDQAEQGQAVLEQLIPQTGNAIRLGVTGPPGAGKSTLIEVLGLDLIERGHRVAVLAVDPTSPVSGGSILGDKTRMEVLSRNPSAFIRPSPSGSSLGGVARRTREAMLLCEAAGYDVVIVETVGIGQSQVAVAGMVDFFLLVLLPGGGDDLQGIKKGVVELADALLVNKADGATAELAERTRVDYANALGVIRSLSTSWSPPVLKASALRGEGVAELWETILAHRKKFEDSGELESRRKRQAREWLWSLLEDGLMTAFRGQAEVASEIERLEAAVEARETTPGAAAQRLLARFLRG
ncbi:MAG: methylmalonyl Co-A mutase-associated GTPase MeaB [Deltaproteobacteria bacterium]|nr:methylmalonyl Co-A mutase-associated GTPase MeaB [Deltaproteobacteria bacterium]MBW2387145.1 methylmalonyl Co-A mutase-associated GTPase MeaB [Deltaproteobacteria bacterium]MBW2724597.1 methylmalonyl Co-A mutase-associated GTPase MeaB [Deltaproteobacteria bacterium]